MHQNKKLEDTKEYYISLYQGVEVNANLLHKIENDIKSDIHESFALLSRKEASHTKLTLTVNKKLEEILNIFESAEEKGK